MNGKPELILIAAVARNGVIGRNNRLPWRLKADLAHFKSVTYGHSIVMGRKTWESLGRPLPGRRNLVVSRTPGYQASGAEVFASPQDAIRAAAPAEKVFVIGGAQLYDQLLGDADRLLLTEVWADVDGDTRLPTIDHRLFEEVRREPHGADTDNEFDYDFVEYVRRR
jgi:dihydrofolate reductase